MAKKEIKKAKHEPIYVGMLSLFIALATFYDLTVSLTVLRLRQAPKPLLLPCHSPDQPCSNSLYGAA